MFLNRLRRRPTPRNGQRGRLFQVDTIIAEKKKYVNMAYYAIRSGAARARQTVPGPTVENCASKAN